MSGYRLGPFRRLWFKDIPEYHNKLFSLVIFYSFVLFLRRHVDISIARKVEIVDNKTYKNIEIWKSDDFGSFVCCRFTLSPVISAFRD